MKNKFWIGVFEILVVLAVLIVYVKLYYFIPELSVTDITFMPKNPIVNVDTETISAKIQNIGKVKAGSFDVCLFDDRKLVDSKLVDGLDKEKSADISFNYKFSTIGHHAVELVVDCKGKIREQNKENNKITLNIETKGSPPSQITVTPPQESPLITTAVFKKKLGRSWYSSQFAGSAPVIYDGKIYVGGKNQYFFCLDKDTGDEIWKYEVTDAGLIPGIYSTPIFYKGNVYFGSTGTNLIESRGHVFSLNAKDGSLVWKYDTDSDVDLISLDNGKIYAYDGSTYVIDALTGKLIKKYSGTVIANNGKIYSVDYTNGILSRIDPTTGKVLWDFKVGEEIFKTPVFYNGKIYIDGKHCIDEESGTLVWENKEIGGVHQTFDRDLLFVGGEEFSCVDASNGQIKWEKAIGTISPPVAINGKVYVAPYVGEYEKKVFCINESTSDIIAIYGVDDVITTSPLVYEGKIYVVAEDGYLYCFKEE